MPTPVRFLDSSIVEVPCDDPGCTQRGPNGEPHMVEQARYHLLDGTLVEELRPGDAFIEPWSARRQQREGTHSCPWTNCDGQHLIVVCPDDAHWNVDGRANNCTMPDDTTHRCWVRHGDPSVPGQLHVDKAGGRTCAAGAGSIQTSRYHGFLHHGVLTDA